MTDRAAEHTAMLAKFREQYPQYDDMKDEDLAKALAARFPDAYGDLIAPDKAKLPEMERPSVASIVGKNIAKIPERAAADVKGAVETFTNPSMAQTLPLAVMGPAGAPVAPLVGAATRIGTQALGRGMDEPGTLGDKAKAALKGGGLATLAEAAVPLLARTRIPFAGASARTAANRLASEQEKVLEENAGKIVQAGKQTEFNAARAAEQTAGREAKVATKTAASEAKAGERTARREQAYQWATTAPTRAIEAMAPTLPEGATVLVPSINASKQITLAEAAEGLGKKRGVEYEQALGELVRELNRVSPRAGDLFKAHVAESIFPPRAVAPKPVPVAAPVTPRPVMAPDLTRVPSGSKFERAATRALPVLDNPALRTAADYEAGNIPDPVLGAGVAMGADAAGGFYDLARHLPTRMLK